MQKERKTLADYQDEIAEKGYGRNAQPNLVEDRTVEGLIRANCQKREGGWKLFAKQIAI